MRAPMRPFAPCSTMRSGRAAVDGSTARSLVRAMGVIVGHVHAARFCLFLWQFLRSAHLQQVV
jgi:hypothetical protein